MNRLPYNPRHRRLLGVLCLLLVSAAALWSAGCGGTRVSVGRDSERYEFEKGKVAFEKKHWLDAQTHLKRFLDVYPGHAAADSAQLLLGLAQYNVKSYAEAAVEFAILVREFPRSPLQDDASFHECECYQAQMSKSQLDPTFAFRTRSCLNEFILRFPDSPLREDARSHLEDIANRLAEKELNLGIMWTKMKRYRAGIIYFDELLQKYPTSVWVPDALFWKGRCHKERHQFTEAANAYRLLIDSFPEHKTAGQARRELPWVESKAAEERRSEAGP